MGGRPNIVQRAVITVRRAKACAMKLTGDYTWQEIADECGYSSAKYASLDVSRALKAYVDTQKAPIEELRARELATLAEVEEAARVVLHSDHLATSGGIIVRDEDGEPLKDHGPTLAAVDRVVKISESRRKLLGEDAPSKVEQTVGGTVEYVVRVSQEEMDEV